MEYNNDFYDSIWWLDINKEGTQFIACSSDFSIKLYEITEEQVKQIALVHFVQALDFFGAQ